MSIAKCPPLLLRRHATMTGMEMLLPPQPTVTAGLPSVRLIDVPNLVWTDEECNRYIFAQCVMYFYISIFMTLETSQIYRDLLKKVAIEIRSAWQSRKVTDRALGEFIRTYFPDGTVHLQGREFIDALRMVSSRLVSDKVYPGINDILAIVCTVYDDRVTVVNDVTLYRVTLTSIEGYASPTFTLTPIHHPVTLNTSNCVSTPDLVWKFINSLNIPGLIQGPGEFTSYLTILAMLALPMDPVELTASLGWNLISNNKAGVSFLNYLAMYFRQQALGIDYTLSRLADPRRMIMQQLHNFCGIGATTIRDTDYVIPFLKVVDDRFECPNIEISDTDDALYRQLKEITSSGGLQFIRKLNYDASTEAARAKITSGDPPEDPEVPDKPVKTKKKTPPGTPEPETPDDTPPADDPKSPDATDTGAFSDDADPTADTSDSSQTSDDIIGQTGDPNQTVPPRPVSTLLPLALPSETIDDHLYRLTVLRYVAGLINAADPDVTAEAINLLKVWCGSLLFIAAATTTRTLVSQLKLTEKLKEFAE